MARLVASPAARSTNGPAASAATPAASAPARRAAPLGMPLTKKSPKPTKAWQKISAPQPPSLGTIWPTQCPGIASPLISPGEQTLPPPALGMQYVIHVQSSAPGTQVMFTVGGGSPLVLSQKRQMVTSSGLMPLQLVLIPSRVQLRSPSCQPMRQFGLFDAHSSMPLGSVKFTGLLPV